MKKLENNYLTHLRFLFGYYRCRPPHGRCYPFDLKNLRWVSDDELIDDSESFDGIIEAFEHFVTLE